MENGKVKGPQQYQQFFLIPSSNSEEGEKVIIRDISGLISSGDYLKNLRAISNSGRILTPIGSTSEDEGPNELKAESLTPRHVEGLHVTEGRKVVENDQVVACSSADDMQTVHYVVANSDCKLNYVMVPNESDSEQMRKKQKVDQSANLNESCKKIVQQIYRAITLRLNSIEEKLVQVTSRCQEVESKVNGLSNHLLHSESHGPKDSKLTVVAPNMSLKSDEQSPFSSNSMKHSTTVAGITLNSKDDYPFGSWLGDPGNPGLRVRCRITPSDLEGIHNSCHTPEKMAVTLLDYLFDRETQACSNLSGQGRHGKKQLDPLMIYGIKCHLIHRFGINNKDWQRIRQNLDSKCRTAFRRKRRGMSLAVKAFKDRIVHPPLTNEKAIRCIKGPTGYTPLSATQVSELHDEYMSSDMVSEHDLSMAHSALTLSSELLHSGDSSIQIVHATPQQLAQLLSSENLMPKTEILS